MVAFVATEENCTEVGRMFGIRGIQFISYLIVVLLISSAQQQQPQSSCIVAKDCSSCMQAGPTCVWCEDKNFTSTTGDTDQSRCNEIDVLKPICKSLKSLESKFNVSSSEDFNNFIQVRPQGVKLQLRPGESQSFRIAVQPAENFPVDIYFLIDRSSSMNDDLDTLISVANKIANTIGNITTEYRLGVGITNDKHLVPQVTIHQGESIFPCNFYASHPGCRPAFSYIHVFNFSNSTQDFSDSLRLQKKILTGDLNDAESPFDGLMQLSVCEKEINWKPKGQGRRIVVLVTDAIPKIAGDGKVSGLFKPNDEICHMESIVYKGVPEKYFSKAEEFDYPSIHQLRNAMYRNDINPILAVTSDVLPTFEEIAKAWKDIAASANLLSNDSSNIVQVLRDNYNRISTTVTLTDNANASVIKIEYKVDRSSCENPDRDNQCSNVKLNQTVFFDVKATLLSCPDNPNEPQQITINTAGFGKVVIDLGFLCECNCTKEYNSSLCSSTGTYQCGSCDCNPDWFGSNCKCDGSKPSQNDTASCIDPSSKDGEICNGNGKCACGKCECSEQEFPKVVTGQYCGCKNYGCPLYNGAIECGGPDRGTCRCGKCDCTKLYEGINCGKTNCTEFTATKCTNKQGEICSGKGNCDCVSQECRCLPGYSGEQCEDCRTSDCKCATIDDCLQCELKNETCDPKLNCSMHTFISSNETFASDCTLSFGGCYYGINFTGDPFMKNESLSVTYQLKFCTTILGGPKDETNTLAYVLGIIFGILLLALLLLLLWKLLITAHDKKEYEQFVNSRKKQSQWAKKGNPIYKEPQQQYVNPAYAGIK